MRKVYLGEFQHSIDKQRRVAIPREWRSDDAEVYYLMPGRDHSVQVMPRDHFMEQVYEKVKNVSFADKNRTLAMLGRFGHECSCDKQGRINISNLLVEHGTLELGGPVVLTGTMTGFEIRRVDEEEVLAESIEQFLDDIESIQAAAKDPSE